MKAYSIRFTKKSAEEFFTALRQAEIQRLLDVRLRNASQLGGFSKRDDLAFFLKELCGADHLHEPRFCSILADRAVEKKINRTLFQIPTVLLCSKVTATRCHRRLILEYLQEKWGNLDGVRSTVMPGTMSYVSA